MVQRIGLLGGTFDPVHNGHLSIFHSFLKSALIDELWILLTPDPPHKSNKNHTEYSRRLDMLQLAVEKEPLIKVSTIENELPKPSFTIQTIRALKAKYPTLDFTYCMGGDSLSAFHLWKNYRDIITETTLLVAERPSYKFENVAEEVLIKTTIVHHTPIAISSSLIRNKISSGKSISALVPKQVEDYILENRLYQH